MRKFTQREIHRAGCAESLLEIHLRLQSRHGDPTVGEGVEHAGKTEIRFLEVAAYRALYVPVAAQSRVDLRQIREIDAHSDVETGICCLANLQAVASDIRDEVEFFGPGARSDEQSRVSPKGDRPIFERSRQLGRAEVQLGVRG